MITTIDKAGRVVIPKALRDEMQLRPGAKLDITYNDGRIEIEYAPVEARVRIAEDGFPILEVADPSVFAAVTDNDLRQALEESRNENVARYM